MPILLSQALISNRNWRITLCHQIQHRPLPGNDTNPNAQTVPGGDYLIDNFESGTSSWSIYQGTTASVSIASLPEIPVAR